MMECEEITLDQKEIGMNDCEMKIGCSEMAMDEMVTESIQ